MGQKFKLRFDTSNVVQEVHVINKFSAFYAKALFYQTIAANRFQATVVHNFNVKWMCFPRRDEYILVEGTHV